MAIYRIKVFTRFASDNDISDEALSAAAQDVRDGKFDADLGGGLYKQRVPREGGGRSRGFRTLITRKTSIHVFFVFGFAKSAADNIGPKEEKALKNLAKTLGNLTDEQIEKAVADGAMILIEEKGDENDEG